MLADLTPERRDANLAELQDRAERGSPWDLIVIGGGITGVGVALDAASRGLETLVLEKHDLAYGTSRWSSKLVHGGLRYLANAQVDVAWESAVERDILMRTIAPHLVTAGPHVIPITTDDRAWSTTLLRAGLMAGDALRIGARTPATLLPRSRRIDRTTVLDLLPALDPRRLRGGLIAWDGLLEDDARLVVAVARTATAHGARVLTGIRVLRADGTGVTASDGTHTWTLAARHVISAVGPAAGSLDAQVRVTPSRGSHVLFAPARLGTPRAAMTVQVPGERARFCFAIPRPDGTILGGVTDVAAAEPVPDVPRPSEDEVTWILGQLSRVLADPLDPSDVIGTFAGIRPLAASDPGARTAGVSRRHLLRRAANGLITITGGKLTTYRRMAQDAVDLVSSRPCRTKDLPLIGAGSPSELARARTQAPDALVRRFGTEAPRVAALADGRPDLLDPVGPGTDILGVDVLFARQCEGARTVDDILERRTRIALVSSEAQACRATVEALYAEFG